MKKELLKLLEQRKGLPVSGGTLGKELSVSRSAVWKAIHLLKEDGYDIQTVPNKGYILNASSDILDLDTITSLLSTSFLGHSLELLNEIDSTNNYLKSRAKDGLPHGHTVLAIRQSNGKGRMGRAFSSPPHSGIYLSFHVKLGREFDVVSLLTVIAAVAVCQAIEQTAGFSPEIKWVNDVLYHGKKLCGILTEAAIEGESGLLDYAVVGIGINVHAVAEEVRTVAGYVNEFSVRPCNRNELIAALLNSYEQLFMQYLETDGKEILEQYRQRLNVFGKEYDIVSPTGSYPATPIDIDENARLIVKDQKGKLHTIHSGEISIRKK